MKHQKLKEWFDKVDVYEGSAFRFSGLIPTDKELSEIKALSIQEYKEELLMFIDRVHDEEGNIFYTDIKNFINSKA